MMWLWWTVVAIFIATLFFSWAIETTWFALLFGVKKKQNKYTRLYNKRKF